MPHDAVHGREVTQQEWPAAAAELGAELRLDLRTPLLLCPRDHARVLLLGRQNAPRPMLADLPQQLIHPRAPKPHPLLILRPRFCRSGRRREAVASVDRVHQELHDCTALEHYRALPVGIGEAEGRHRMVRVDLEEPGRADGQAPRSELLCMRQRAAASGGGGGLTMERDPRPAGARRA